MLTSLWHPRTTRAGNGHAPALNGHPSPDPGLLRQAEAFITAYHAETPDAGSPARRLAQVAGQIALTGTYTHAPAELEYAARVAWRNSSRCIGRLYWHSLVVRDLRHVTSGAEVAAQVAAHLAQATNGGKIRPVISVFAPDAPGRPGPRILSPQVITYAGYETGGKVTGDPASVRLTRSAHRLGWPGRFPPGRFDILPLLVQGAGEDPAMYELPASSVLEVPLTHPHFPWFKGLGLRWYAVPVISDMYLQAGGICYPCAPFNGWYMCTEVGSRDLGDTTRYDQLPVVAARMGLPLDSGSLWQDRAMTELNTAVLHSFRQAGVTITDHHTESERFLKHLETEERHGRPCPADWSWIVPPAAGSTCPVFHRYYQDFDADPNFYRHT